MLRVPLILIALSAGCTAERAISLPPSQVGDVAPADIAVTNTGAGTPREIVRRKNVLIEFGEHALEIDPGDGGRVVAFSLGGRSVVIPRDESPEAYGSSFWPSPQSDWSWPPPPAFDKAAWGVSIEGNVLTLSSGKDDKLGISGEQRIWAEPARGSVVIEHVIKNHDSKPLKVAAWQNTRVRPRGLSFFPSTSPPLPESALKLAPEDGIVWFLHNPAVYKQGSKGFADGAEGWLAHVDGDLLLVKVFPDIPRTAQAPKEAEIEIYVDGAGRFVEVEQQGAYAEIAPGATSVWQVRWLLRRLPADLNARQGNPKLVEFVRALVAAK